MSNMRIIEIKINENWVPTQMSALRTGDVFRMFEETHSNPVGLPDGTTELVASTDAYQTNGVWGIDVVTPLQSATNKV